MPSLPNPLPPVPGVADPVLGYRFSVLFLVGGVVPNPLDLRFRKVSGLSGEVQTTSLEEGGQNLYAHPLPDRVRYGKLLLERGFVVGSPLNLEFNAALALFRFAPSNVLVTLLGATALPLAAWMFFKAFPTRWSTSDLDAGEAALAVDTLELAYTRMQILRV